MRRLILVALVPLLLAACQDDQRPALSVTQARQVQAQFQGQSSFTPPPRTVSDITALLERYKPDQAKIDGWHRAVASQPPAGATPMQLHDFYLNRGYAQQSLGRTREQVADMREAVRVATAAGIAAPRATQQLMFAELIAGNLRSAKVYGDDYLRQARAGGRGGNVLNAQTNQAVIHAALGDLENAERSLREAEQMLNDPNMVRWEGYQTLRPDWENSIQRARTDLDLAAGRFTGAETMARRAVANAAIMVRTEPAIRRLAPDMQPDVGRVVENASIVRLGHALLRQGRVVEAELEYRKALVAALELFGRYEIRTPALLTALSMALMEQGRFEDASRLAEAALDIYRTLGVDSGSRAVARAHALLAVAADLRGDSAAAARAWAAALAVFAADPEERFRAVEVQPAYLASAVAGGRAAEVVAAAERVVTFRRDRLGDRHYDTAEARGLWAAALAAGGQRDRALAEFRAALPVLLQASRQSEDTEGRAGRDRVLQVVLESYIDLLSGLAPGAVAEFDPAAEAFRVADAARARGVQRALAASAARASIADPDLANLVRQEQDAQKQIAAQFGLLSNILAAPADQQDAAATQALRVNIDRLRDARAALRGEIERRFPDYANLIDPRPSTVAEVQAQLRPGEALLSTYVGRGRTYVWAIPQAGRPAFAAAPLGEAEVTRAVAELRRALDPNAATLGDIPAYDVALAHRLYAGLVQPVQAGLAGANSLLVVPDKALGQVSFALLVTAPTPPVQDAPGAALFSGYARVPFLARQMAITQLPSVAALATLRRVPPGDASRRAFAGFGDPWFSPEQAREAQATQTAALTTRGLQTRGLPLVRRNAPQTQGVSSAELAQLPRLPDTADEVRSIALALKADPGADIFLGARANERQVKTLNLADRKVVMFATHGLVPGDLNGLTQPALALSAPALSNSDGDGLLTMDEILGLRLNADWVVLSACNTATGDGAGAEAVSGLGRAFFYAGTRALLVTNWPVETTSARALTTDLFARQAANPALPRARAMQQAMLGLIDGPGFVDDGKTVFSYAHPIFWAPFSVVGDGGGSQAGS